MIAIGSLGSDDGAPVSRQVCAHLKGNESFGISNVGVSRRVRVHCLLKSSAATMQDWLSAELCCMFSFVFVPPMTASEEVSVLCRTYPRVPQEAASKLVSFANHLRYKRSGDANTGSMSICLLVRSLQCGLDQLTCSILACGAGADAFGDTVGASMSTRQVLRVGRRLQSQLAASGGFCDVDDLLWDEIKRALLSRFMPAMAEDALDKILQFCNVVGGCLATMDACLPAVVGVTVSPTCTIGHAPR